MNHASNEIREKVVKALVDRKSMPFLEITSLCNLHGHDLKVVIEDLEKEGLVRVKNPDDDVETIVTATATLLRVNR